MRERGERGERERRERLIDFNQNRGQIGDGQSTPTVLTQAGVIQAVPTPITYLQVVQREWPHCPVGMLSVLQ